MSSPHNSSNEDDRGVSSDADHSIGDDHHSGQNEGQQRPMIRYGDNADGPASDPPNGKYMLVLDLDFPHFI